jgi:hypothetical protein
MLERSFHFTTLYDFVPDDDGISGVFTPDASTLKDMKGDKSDYEYGEAYQYKEMPVLKAWLIQQKLELN